MTSFTGHCLQSVGQRSLNQITFKIHVEKVLTDPLKIKKRLTVHKLYLSKHSFLLLHNDNNTNNIIITQPANLTQKKTYIQAQTNIAKSQKKNLRTISKCKIYKHTSYTVNTEKCYSHQPWGDITCGIGITIRQVLNTGGLFLILTLVGGIW